MLLRQPQSALPYLALILNHMRTVWASSSKRRSKTCQRCGTCLTQSLNSLKRWSVAPAWSRECENGWEVPGHRSCCEMETNDINTARGKRESTLWDRKNKTTKHHSRLRRQRSFPCLQPRTKAAVWTTWIPLHPRGFRLALVTYN